MEPTTPITGTNASRRRTSWVCAALAGLMVVTASCGSDDEDAGIADQEEWCASMADVDQLFADGEINSDDFDLARSAAGDLRERFEELSAGVGVVDPDVRDSVSAEIDYGLAFTTAYSEADDLDEAMGELQRIWSDSGEDGALGRAWVLDTCGVDMTD